jgi:integrase/recombinase XerD
VKIILRRSESSYRLHGEHNLVEPGNAFLQDIETRGLSPYTVRSYGFDLVIFIRWLIAKKISFEKIDYSWLTQFMMDEKLREVGPKSINRRLITIQTFYRYCYDKLVPRGPRSTTPAPHYGGQGKDRIVGAIDLSRPSALKLRVKEPQAMIVPLAPSQVRALIEAFLRYRDLAIFQLMLFCGLRSCEVLSLKIGDIGFFERQIRVRGKGNKERMLPLPNRVAETLEKYHRLERPSASSNTHFFLVLQGKRQGHSMTPAGIRSLFRYRRQKDKELESANPHRVRHTFGSAMAREKVPLPVLQRLMGHHHPRVTLGYIYLSMGDIAEEFQRASENIQKRYEQITKE